MRAAVSGLAAGGVDATMAGVALGLLTPTGEVGWRNVLEKLEHRLHPLSAFVIVPLFAFANAGVDLRVSSFRVTPRRAGPPVSNVSRPWRPP